MQSTAHTAVVRVFLLLREHCADAEFQVQTPE